MGNDREMEQWGDGKEVKQMKKKAQETSFDVSWAFGKFFFVLLSSFHC